MSPEIILRVTGFKAVHLQAPVAVLGGLDSGDGSIWDAELYVSRLGICAFISALGKEAGYLPAGDQWVSAFNSLHPPESALWGGQRVPLRLTGMLAAHVVRVLHDWRPPQRRRGGPKRAERWHHDREEFFANVLRYTQDIEHGDAAKVTKAIAAAAADDPVRFGRIFSEGGQEQGLEAARRDYYRRIEEFEAAPVGTTELGRILALRFEFEDGAAE